MSLRANPIHRLLHLPVTAIASLQRVRHRRQQFVAQKNKALLQRRRFQLLETLRQFLEPLDSLPEFSQLFQCRVDRTAAVEQTIHLVLNLPQLSQLGKSFRNLAEFFTLLRRQCFLDEKETMVEQRRDLRLNPFVPFDDSLVFGFRRSSPLRSFRHRFAEFATDRRHRFQDRLVDLLQDVPCCDIRADLMPDTGKNSVDRFRIKIRTVRRDAVKNQTAMSQDVFERIQKFTDVVLVRTAFENPVRQATKLAIVDDGENAERSVVHFVDGDVTGEFFKSDGEVIVRFDEQPSFRVFMYTGPPPRPSFGSWRRERKRDGHARDANWLPCTVNRLRRRPGWQARRRRACSVSRERQRWSCRR